MERCCTTEECVNKSSNECHRDVAVRASEGWKLKWTDPGPEIKVIHSIVPGPFAEPKILKALPYQLVSKCGSCVARNRPRLRNGIPDPWLEYLNYDAWKEDQEFNEDPGKKEDPMRIKRCIKITDYVWQKKGLSLLQGIPDPWKSDIPCACEIRKGAKKKKRSQDKEFTRRRSSTNERETPSRRSSTRGTPRRKSRNEEESLSRSVSVNGECPLGHQNANHEEKSPSRRSSINEESPRRRSSNKRAENTKRRIKYTEIDNKELIRRQSKSEGKAVRCTMCYAVEPSETAYVCYGGIVPACLRDYFEECPMRRSKGHEEKSRRHRSRRCDEEPIRRSRKKCDQEVPTKRRHKNCDVILKERLKSCEELVECRKKSRQDRRSKSRSKYKTKESTGRLSCATSEGSSEFSVEALKKSRKPCDATKHKVEQEKAPPHSVKKLRTCSSGFEKVKQRLQELENDLKAREAAKELKLREMEQLSKLRRKACKERKYRVCKQFCKQRGNDWSGDEAMDKIRCNWKESVSSRANCCLKCTDCSILTDRSKNKEVKDSTPCNNKVSKFNLRLDEPSAVKKELSKESAKSPKKTEAPKVASHIVRESKSPQTPIKSICKKTKAVTAKAHSPTKSRVNPPCPANPRRVFYNEEVQPSTRTSSPCSPSQRRVSYEDEPQPSSRTCSPCSPSHRRVAYDDEPQPSSRTRSACSPSQRRVSYNDEHQPLMTRTSSPCFRKCHQGSNDDKPVTSKCNSSKSPRCISIPRSVGTISPKESKESMEKFLEEINSRIEITQDALKSPCMKSVAVQPFQEEATKIWRCPGRELCPRMRERAGADKDSELFVRRVRVSEAVDRDVEVVAKLEETFKFNEMYVENNEDSDASDCNAGASRTYQQRSYRAGALADFERRQKEIEEIELFVESFSERDC